MKLNKQESKDGNPFFFRLMSFSMCVRNEGEGRVFQIHTLKGRVKTHTHRQEAFFIHNNKTPESIHYLSKCNVHR